MELFGRPSMSKGIKSKILSWLGHMHRIDNHRSIEKVSKKRNKGMRKRETPKKRWVDYITGD